ncbi:uncharacterized protein LOC121267980 [Juglans microcarpa x Juglans regia]|uniref:uncharacterized protein LOC121267980 n=1 Tax=Juglans microcarpa x Juglans regia TaxID=2249226 RepID=UPI001B7E80D7|nr:uncharacterized protein LOC121267980 [Juglans microcarpa x Juglans regia]
MGKVKAVRGLGFRDLEQFNLAMLAKQGWRLLQNPNSLATRDKWLPHPTSYRIQSGVKSLDTEANMEALINPVTKSWKMQLIKEIFSEEEAANMSQIHVSLCNSPKKIWSCTTNGIFFVRSAYHLQVEIQQRAKGQSSNTYEQKERCGKLAVPNVEKVFLWKACNDGLPTKMNLFKKKVVEDCSCPICLQYEESIEHAIGECESMRDWDITKLRVVFNPNVVADVLKTHLCSVVSEDKRLWANEKNEMFSVRSCYWFIFYHMGSQSAESSTMQNLNVLWKHLWKMKVPNKVKIFAWRVCKNSLPTGANLMQKRVLTEDMYRLLFSELGRTYIVAVLRDASGRVLMAVSKAKTDMDGIKALELMAILRRLQLCVTMGLPKLVIESDSLICIEALQEGREYGS